MPPLCDSMIFAAMRAYIWAQNRSSVHGKPQGFPLHSSFVADSAPFVVAKVSLEAMP